MRGHRVEEARPSAFAEATADCRSPGGRWSGSARLSGLAHRRYVESLAAFTRHIFAAARCGTSTTASGCASATAAMARLFDKQGRASSQASSILMRPGCSRVRRAAVSARSSRLGRRAHADDRRCRAVLFAYSPDGPIRGVGDQTLVPRDDLRRTATPNTRPDHRVDRRPTCTGFQDSDAARRGDHRTRRGRAGTAGVYSPNRRERPRHRRTASPSDPRLRLIRSNRRPWRVPALWAGRRAPTLCRCADGPRICVRRRVRRA